MNFVFLDYLCVHTSLLVTHCKPRKEAQIMGVSVRCIAEQMDLAVSTYLEQARLRSSLAEVVKGKNEPKNLNFSSIYIKP